MCVVFFGAELLKHGGFEDENNDRPFFRAFVAVDSDVLDSNK